MKDFYETNTTYHILFKEVHADGRFYISKSRLTHIKLSGKRIVVEYKDEKYSFTYKEWMNGARKMEKVFLFPDRPMILYGQVLSKGKKIVNEQPDNVSAINNLANMPEIYRNQIKASLGLT